MKMFVTRDEALHQNNGSFSSSPIHKLTLKRTSHDITFENDTCDNSNVEYSAKKEHNPVGCSSDLVQHKVSNLFRFDKVYVNKSEHIKAIDQSIKQVRSVMAYMKLRFSYHNGN